MAYVVQTSIANPIIGIKNKTHAEVETIAEGVAYVQNEFPGWNMYWEMDADGADAADIFIYKGAMSHVYSIEKVK